MGLDGESLLPDVVAAVVRRNGFDLEDLAVRDAGRRQLVRVVIDRDAGVDLDAAAGVSREISDALDEGGDDVLGGRPYTLEVTSPGIGRPLSLPRHFRRATGRLVSLTLAHGDPLRARILRLADRRLEVLTGADGLTRQTIDLADIVRAKVEVEFSEPSAEVSALVATARAETSATDGPPPPEGVDAR